MFLLDPFKEKLFWNLLKSLEMVLFLEHQAAAAARALARYLPWYANLIWRVHVRFTLVIISCWEGPQKLSLPLWVFFFFSFRQMWNLPFFMLIGWLGFYKQPKWTKIWKKVQILEVTFANKWEIILLLLRKLAVVESKLWKKSMEKLFLH